MSLRIPGLLRPFLSCRLCWRITLAVFALILVVEAAILVPSSRQFERNERKRLADQAQLLVEPALARAQATGAHPELQALLGAYGLLGIALYPGEGPQLAAVGDAPPPQAGMHDMHARALPDGRRPASLLAAWESPSLPGTRVVVRADAAEIEPRLRAFQWRIAGLVLIIVVVVTAGTMLVVDATILRAVLRLRSSSQRAGADPLAAEKYRLRTRRRDEMGELIEAHNAMLLQVSASARYLAHHDPLTGLPNRAALTAQLDRESVSRGVTLFLVNLVGFRAINAGYGTDAGDRLVRGLVSRLQAQSEPEDMVSHLGADRFALARSRILPPADASALAERIIGSLSLPFDVADGVSVSPAVRVGIAQSGPQARDGQALLAQADLALSRTYGAQDVKFQFFSTALASEARERQALARDLERALERKEFWFALQPRFRLVANGVAMPPAGAELLLRWRHPVRGEVGPAQFIPLAESNGLILPIGAHVLESACELVRGWRRRGVHAPRLAVNLSAQQFAQPELLRTIEAALECAAIPADALEFEVTETAAMRDATRTAATIAGMRALGVHVSIDDFGTGHSSLNYLRRFAVDAIKIDKSFVDDIGRDDHADAICDAILHLGHSLGTRVVAEGVENETQAGFLLQRGCDEVQGYLYGRPVPAAEFECRHLLERAA